MIVIGIVGGVASGKSLVSRQLERLGAEVMDVDRVAHEVLRLADVERAVRTRWGSSVFGDDGHVDRAKLAEIVFAPPPNGPEQLAYLERLTHPQIEERMRRRASRLKQEGHVKALVLDAAVLIKAGWDRICDKVVFVDVPAAQRVARARQRGWSEAEFAAREAVQESLHSKRQRADVVIDNSGTPQQTMDQVEEFWRSFA